MERSKIKLRNQNAQRSFVCQTAYAQGWNDADGSHWREPSERPYDMQHCLLFTIGEQYIPAVWFEKYKQWEGFGMAIGAGDIQCWMAIPKLNVSKR